MRLRTGCITKNNARHWNVDEYLIMIQSGIPEPTAADRTGPLGTRGPTFRYVDPWIQFMIISKQTSSWLIIVIRIITTVVRATNVQTILSILVFAPFLTAIERFVKCFQIKFLAL